MRVSISGLVCELSSLRAPGTRMGLLDDDLVVSLNDPSALVHALDAAVSAIQYAFPETVTVANVRPNSTRQTICLRFKQCPGGSVFSRRSAVAHDALVQLLNSLGETLRLESGLLGYDVGASSFDVHLPDPTRSPHRTDFPSIEGLSWEHSYRYLLSRASWSSLRDRAFERSSLAATLADLCQAGGLRVVLIPSVGLSIHPWIFADRGLKVVATDLARSALVALSRPQDRPRMYSRAACERWDIDMTASCEAYPHPERFPGLLRLEESSFTDELGSSISFLQADWSSLPLQSQSVDLVFAINALPRESQATLDAVIAEWVRVTRKGGLLFVAQHNPGSLVGAEEHTLLEDWQRVDLLAGEKPTRDAIGGVQWLFSSD